MRLPGISNSEKLRPNKNRLFIGAYGFEDRSLGWVGYQKEQGAILTDALLFRYKRPKGKNRITQLQKAVQILGVSTPSEVIYDYGARFPGNVEESIAEGLAPRIPFVEEVVLDISAMSKLLILICLCKLRKFTGTLRIVSSGAEFYAPTQEEYADKKEEVEIIAKYPSRGVDSIVRTRCLSSIRMQGQPVTMVAFTSFNEQLVRHMLGTINPHRLLFINGRPPREDYKWREVATQEIHKNIIEEYSNNNPTNEEGLLTRVVSTLDYRETIECLDQIYEEFGIHERIICAATGSKMQTVGLFFSKIAHPDIHIEYPTPNSYYVKGMSNGVRDISEVVIPNFLALLKEIQREAFD